MNITASVYAKDLYKVEVVRKDNNGAYRDPNGMG
jgi:hypothetical protein